MRRITFITPHDAKHGFSLSGTVQHSVAPHEAEAKVRQAMADPDCGVVIIDERLVSAIGYEKFQEMEKRWFGVLLVLPAPAKIAEGEEDYAQRLIHRVIGYHVRLTV